MFQSESALYSCLNVKELLSRNRHEIWSSSDCNGTRTHNHLVRKRKQGVRSKQQGVPWHSGNYRVWIHSETHTWHDKSIQSNAPYRKVLTTQFNHLASYNNIPKHIRMKVGKYTLAHSTKDTLAKFSEEYPKYTFKRMSIYSWKASVKNNGNSQNLKKNCWKEQNTLLLVYVLQALLFKEGW